MSEDAAEEARKSGLSLSREAIGLIVLSLFSACEGLGPFAGAWLTANPIRQYSPAELGNINAFQQTLATVLQPFVGKFVDWTRHKRALLGLGSLAVGASVAVTVFIPQWFWLQFVIQLPMALGMMLVPLSLNSLTLGTISPEKFTKQVALNNVATHVGTVFSGVFMAACALFLPKISGADGEEVSSPTWSCVPLISSVLTVLSLPMIRSSEIDYARASGAVEPAVAEEQQQQAGADANSLSAEQGCSAHAVRGLFRRGAFLRLMALAFTLNFANMAQLQLVVQHASTLNPRIAIPFTSAAQVIAHLGMTLAALVAGRFADSVGRKPLLLVMCFVVCVRALLTAATDIWWVARGGSVWLTLLPCQGLDGVGAGLWGVLVVILVRDVSVGTGCFNLAFGSVQAFFACGAIVSSEVSGLIAENWGFGAAFLVLGLAGAVATLQAFCFPETLQRCAAASQDGSSAGESKV